MLSSPKIHALIAAAASLALAMPSASAVDYAGGWASADQCVDICSTPSATCLTKDPACLAKAKVPGDFDYLVLEQIFMPQFCRDLLVGVDGTISHQNINPYPDGLTCVADRVSSELTIHGLWPNYDDGYVSCCNPSDSVNNDPYDAAAFATNQADLLATMGEKWIDPSQASTHDTLCEIYDHEFQKHGLCYAAQGADLEAAAVTYFQATLNTADRLSAANDKIKEWAASKSHETTLADIQALYDHQVIVLCSAVDGENQLSVIRTCYEKPEDIGANGPTTQIDCANATATTTFSVCSGDEPITLLPYVAPSNSTGSSSSSGSYSDVGSSSGSDVDVGSSSNTDSSAGSSAGSVTNAPTSVPTTQAPTSAPTTQAPTSAPTTQAPANNCGGF